MGESTYRSGRKKGFVVLFRDVAQDERLSLEARGLYAMMVSLPENWEYTVTGLAKKAGCGREKLRRLLRELQAVGYLVREQSHDAGGRFGGNVYVLQDEAPLPENPSNGEEDAEPLPENPSTVQPSTGEPSTGFLPQKNNRIKEQRIKEPPKSPAGGKRRKKSELSEDAKPILRSYVGEDRELAQALGALIEVRIAKKAVNSARAISMLLCELDKLAQGRREDKLLILRQSVTNSWKGVFPLKGTGGYQHPVNLDERSRVVEEEGTYLL